MPRRFIADLYDQPPDYEPRAMECILAADFDTYKTRVEALLRLYRRYIKFLAHEEGKGAAFLMVHSMGYTETSRPVKLGKMFRERIAAIDAELEHTAG